MAQKFLGPNILFDSSVAFSKQVTFDSSVYIGDPSVQLYRNNNELVFRDASAGTKTLYELANPSINQIKYRDRIPFNSNLDTVSPPILMRGGVITMNMYPESKLNDDLTFLQVRLDSTDTWTDVSIGVNLAASITTMLAWVTANVGSTTQWEYRVVATYDSGQNGETSILVDYII